MDFTSLIGQKLVFGFDGTTLPDSFSALVREYKIGNVLLFRHNVESAAQLRRLCAEIQALIRTETGLPAFIMIDQEGGMVTRLSEDAVTVPGSMALAATGEKENVYRAARITARQLRGTGVNFNLAPVLDVNSNPHNPSVGVRSFGDNPQRVAELGAEAVRGYRDGGILCCAKHFPGHGDTAVDSHVGLPCIDKPLKALLDVDLVPFQAAVREGVPAVMSTHILFPQLEKERVPATMSRTIMHGLLREKLGFDGLVLSDCVVMDAIRRHYGTAEGAVAAMRAGIDLVLVSGEEPLQRGAAAATLQAARESALDGAELQASFDRIAAAKARFAFTEPEPELAGRPEDFEAAEAMAQQAVTHVSGALFPADADTFFCGCADYRVSRVANETADAAAFPVFMQRAFGGGCAVCATDPSEEEIADIVRQAAGCRRAVLSTCNAHVFRGQLALAEALQATGLPLMTVTLRNPYDLPLLPKDCAKLAAWDYSAAAMRAVAEVLRGGACFGRMPVGLGE